MRLGGGAGLVGLGFVVRVLLEPSRASLQARLRGGSRGVGIQGESGESGGLGIQGAGGGSGGEQGRVRVGYPA